jgi:pimeloyl-ACP methyl ester carboxylesterase
VTATLVLVHGGTVTSTMWDPVLPHLRAPAIAPDLPGRRHHPADLGRVARADWSAAVADAVVARDLADVVLVGHSSGGYVIPGTAALVPDRVRRLVFIAATVPSEGTRPVDHLKARLTQLALDTEDAMRAGAAGRTLGGLRPGEPPIDTDLEIVENEGRMGLDAPNPLFEPFTWAGVPRAVPRTFVRCVHDRVVTPELVDVMLENMGGAELVDVEAGHEVTYEAPEALAAILDDLADR